jgi:hypothetical protein
MPVHRSKSVNELENTSDELFTINLIGYHCLCSGISLSLHSEIGRNMPGRTQINFSPLTEVEIETGAWALGHNAQMRTTHGNTRPFGLQTDLHKRNVSQHTSNYNSRSFTRKLNSAPIPTCHPSRLVALLYLSRGIVSIRGS